MQRHAMTCMLGSAAFSTWSRIRHPQTLTTFINSISDSSPLLFSFRQFSASKSATSICVRSGTMSDVLRKGSHYSMRRHAFGLLIVTPLLLPFPLADMISESWLKHLLPLGFVRIPVAARPGKLMQSIRARAR